MNSHQPGVKRRFVLAAIAGLALLLVCAVFSLRFGAVSTPFSQLLTEIRAGEGIVFNYRLPRLIIAILIGINMTVAGSMMQGITRNPLAAPDLIGITAGGGLVSVIMLLIVPDFSPMMLPVAAFCGAAAAGILVYLLAYQRSGVTTGRMVLSGIAVGGGLQALIMLILVKYAPNASQALVFLKGSLYARSWEHVGVLLPWTLIGLPLAFLASKQLNLLLLDESTVKALGMKVGRVRLLLMILVVSLAGSAVAVAGTIAFVGLVVPHLARLVAGPDYRLIIPLSALFGSLLVVLSDTLGRIVIPPLEIPAGIITALLGAPYFLYLLVRKA